MFFLGYRKTHKLQQTLEESLSFQQEKLTGETLLKEIRVEGVDYVGLSLAPSLSYSALIQTKEKLQTILHSYCPEFSFLDPELLFEQFSPAV